MKIKDTGCKELTQDDFLDILENYPNLKEKFEDIGISSINDDLVIELNYSDLLTEEEKIILNKVFPEYANSNERFVKFGDGEGMNFICNTDTVCDKCYQSLLKTRKENYYKK